MQSMIITCPLRAAPLPEKESGDVKTKRGHSLPRGKKEPAEQVIPYAASVEVEVGRGKTHLRGRAATVDPAAARCETTTEALDLSQPRIAIPVF